MDKWKFVKSKDGIWWLVIENVEQLIEYKKLTDGRYGDYICDINNRIPESKRFNELAIMIAEREGLSQAEGMLAISLRVTEGQVNMLNQHGVLYINQNGGYNSSITPIKTVLMNNLMFPHFTVDDIKVHQQGGYDDDGWKKGFHYYARVGPIEVRDGDTIKWDTYQEAYDQALQYVNEA